MATVTLRDRTAGQNVEVEIDPTRQCVVLIAGGAGYVPAVVEDYDDDPETCDGPVYDEVGLYYPAAGNAYLPTRVRAIGWAESLGLQFRE